MKLSFSFEYDYLNNVDNLNCFQNNRVYLIPTEWVSIDFYKLSAYLDFMKLNVENSNYFLCLFIFSTAHNHQY